MGKLTVNTIEDNGNNTIVTADGLGDVTVRANTIDAVTGTSSLTLGGTNATSITLGSGASFSNVSGQNYPAFYVYANADQNITVDTDTQVILGSELFDTDNAFASNTFTVPTGKGGKYIFMNKNRADNVGGIKFARTQLYVNDSAKTATEQRPYTNSSGHEIMFTSSYMLELDAGDTVKYYFRTSSSSVILRGNADAQLSNTWFLGYRIGA